MSRNIPSARKGCSELINIFQPISTLPSFRGIDGSYTNSSRHCETSAVTSSLYRAFATSSANQYERITDLTTLYRYWDWTLDYHDLPGSSIWDNEEGFGHQGAAPPSIGVTTPGQPPSGKCVEGPFKDVKLLHWNLTVHPHCLSRQFILDKSEDHGTFSGELMSPDSMGSLSRAREYGSLRYGMEGIHDVIHNGVLGDLNTWSSANGKSYLALEHKPSLRRVPLTSPQIPSSGCTMLSSTESGGNGSWRTPRTGCQTTATRLPNIRSLMLTKRWNTLGCLRTGRSLR